MSIDATVPVYLRNAQSYGNVVTIQTSDSSHQIEVWRAPDNGSGAPNDGAAAVCATLPASPRGGVTFLDLLPNDGAPRYYKSRHVDAVGNFSTFTTYSDGLVPVLVDNTWGVQPMAAYGAIVDSLTTAKYEMRLASTYLDPDTLDGMQSYIDFPATTNFMRVGQTPQAIAGSTNANPSVVNVTAHGYTTGDVVTIRGHTVNTTINGTWTITVVDANHFSVPVAGVGVGGATGHVVRLSLTVDGSGNLTSYGALVTRVLKVLDNNNAVIMDVESGKRILAVPIQDLGTKSATFNIDLSSGLTQKFMISGGGLFQVTFSNGTPGSRYRVIMQQDAVGNNVMPAIWVNNIMWPNDTTPTLSTAPGAFDIFDLEYLGTPNRFIGTIIGQNLLPLTPIVSPNTTETNFATATTAHSCILPGGSSGDLILAVVANSAGIITTPAGWTMVGGSSSNGCGVYAALNGSVSSPVNFVTSAPAQACIKIYGISRWSGNIGDIVTSTTFGTSANPQSPSVTPATLDRHLFISCFGSTGAPTISVYPTNYTLSGTNFGQERFTSGGGSVTLGLALRTLFTGSAQSPSAYTISASQTWQAVTITVPPPAN